MSRNEPYSTRAETVRGDTDLDPRTRRAIKEQMDVLFVGIGTYVVHSESGSRYEIDIFDNSCTCPDWQDSTTTARCKHIRRVDMEIDAGTVPRPDGRIANVSSISEHPKSILPPRDRLAKNIGDKGILVSLIPEFDRYERSTGATFWRRETCGREAIRRQDLKESDSDCHGEPE